MITETFSKARELSGPKRIVALLGLAFSLTGCISPTAGSDGRYTTPIGNAPVINNETPYSSALRCLGTAIGPMQGAPRIAVGNIRDYTGKVDKDGGPALTQGGSLMAISALSKARVRLVERYDTSITELELKYASSKLIGDDAANDGDYRKIMAGSIQGSNYYLVGGITELNYDIRNGGVDAGVTAGSGEWGGSLNARQFVMNVGIDMRLVNSETLEVVNVVSYQKQIIGREVSAGVFDFLGGNLFDLSAGEKANEPLQLAVRSVIERAVLEMIVPLYGVNPKSCTDFGRKGDPLGKIEFQSPAPHSARMAAVPASTQIQDPYDYYRKPAFDSSDLRGSTN
ncbi:MAG: transcriptional regulator [Rhizobiales bacterium]|nr:transcriptional regulator [Hyphomicrobiales bacterium]